MKNILPSNPFRTFYVVFTYIIAFTLWWAYLLYAKNETAYKENVELQEIRFHQTNADANYHDTAEFQKSYSKYKRQKFMILSEGLAFLALMFIGLMRVRKVFLQEIQLAEQQKNFMLSITHELKSPLSSIKLSLQTMSMRKLDADKSERLISNSLSDIDRLDSLIDNILFAAKIERNETGFSDTETNISELTSYIVQKFSDNKKSIAIETQIQPNIYMQVDGMAFTSVIINLLENALKYSEENTQVKLSLEAVNNVIALSVADNGLGIPDEFKKRIFEKFYRIGSEETRTTKGTGLGLYIAKRVVEIYDGTIEVTDNQPNGTIFNVTFPLATIG